MTKRIYNKNNIGVFDEMGLKYAGSHIFKLPNPNKFPQIKIDQPLLTKKTTNTNRKSKK